MTAAVVPLFALLALVGAGCGGHASQGTGVARVMAQMVDDPLIARLVVTVSPGQGTPSFRPIVTDLAKSGPGIWLGRISGIPAGHLRQFDVKAYDSAGNELYSGSGQSDIVAGGVAVISIAISKPAPPPVVNSFPVIDSVAWSRDQVAPGDPVQLAASAHDPDGDPVTYRWQASCVDSSNHPLATNGSFDDATRTTPVWTAPAAQGVCNFSLGVTDSHGATTTVAFTITVTTEVGSADVTVYLNSWPVIMGMTGTLQVASTMVGDLSVQATDPDGDPLTYAWSSPDCAGIVFDTSSPHGPSTPHFTLPLPATTCRIVVTVSDGKVPAGQGTEGILYLPATVPSVLCAGVTCLSGQACNPVNGQCGGTCIPACVGKSCGPDGCGLTCGTCSGATPVCDATGQCVAACTPSCSGTTCGPDGCGGTCSCPPTAPVCNASGQCVATSCTPSCSGTTCGSDGCGGTCKCSDATQTCDTTTGQCVAACTPSCSGTTCGPDGCGGTCSCSSTTPFCDASGQCLPASSGPTAVVPVAAADFPITPPAGLAMDTAANSYVTGPNYSMTPVSFGGISLTSPLGDADIVVAQYNAAGAIQWALDIGDDDPAAGTDQIPLAAAVTKNGTLAVIGAFSGTMTFGTSVIGTASTNDFLVALDSSGNRLWAKQFNDGNNGQIVGVAANPNLASNRIAVCGKTSLAAGWVKTGQTFAGGTADAVIGVFDSLGNKLWAAELGNGAFYESCTAVTIDDNGDVIAAGQFDSATFSFPTSGTPITLTGPAGAGAQKYIWVAKFAGAGNGAGGAKVLAAVAYAVGAGQASPTSLVADASGNVVMGGLFTSSVIFGTTTLTTAGGNDGFVAKLDGAGLAPVWPPVRIGGTGSDQVNGVAVSSVGDVVVTGSFAASNATFKAGNGGFDTSGIGQLHNAGGADAFVLILNGATGALDSAAAYGDGGSQNGDRVCVNRYGTDQVSLAGTVGGSINFGAAGTITPTSGPDAYLVVAKLQ
jgi:hypothetical protein